MSGRETTRERITRLLRNDSYTPAALSAEFDDPTITEAEVFDHLDHVRRSVGERERLLVAPPTCRDCGFDRFDDPAGNPSRCPGCRSESLSDPVFTIRQTE